MSSGSVSPIHSSNKLNPDFILGMGDFLQETEFLKGYMNTTLNNNKM